MPCLCYKTVNSFVEHLMLKCPSVASAVQQVQKKVCMYSVELCYY